MDLVGFIRAYFVYDPLLIILFHSTTFATMLINYYYCVFHYVTAGANSGSYSDVMTPEYCRKCPDSCIDYVCSLIKSYGVDCKEQGVRSTVYNRLPECLTFETCFKDLAREIPSLRAEPAQRWTPNQANYETTTFSAELPAQTEAWTQAETEAWTQPETQAWTQGETESYTQQPEVRITPAKCRGDPDACLPWACSQVSNKHNVNCDNELVRNWTIDTLLNCHHPQVETCLNGPLPETLTSS